MSDWSRPLDAHERALVDAAMEGARARYAGEGVPHRSCGISLAETFQRRTAPYQALRKGGITGRGECGTALGGRMVLGELLGDPDPGGKTTVALREAVLDYEARWEARVGVVDGCRRCDHLMRSFEDFGGPARKARCTGLAQQTAGLVAEVLVRHGHGVQLRGLAED